MKKILLILAVFSCISAFISAKDIYVSQGKNGDGSKVSPYSDISVALATGAYQNDVIHVSEGVYYGEGGGGKWVIENSGLTIAGGYSKDFTQRDPWKFKSLLIRGMGEGALEEGKIRRHDKKLGLDLSLTRAGYNPGPMITCRGNASNIIIDGFFIDGYTRNTYKKNGDLDTGVGPIGNEGSLISFNKPGCKIRNCVIMNSGGPGIKMIASGKKNNPDSWNEVTNCIIINTLMEAVDLRVGTWDPANDPEGGYALIRNNTFAFIWSHSGEGYGIIIGRQTRLTIDCNIIAFAADFGMNNGFGNDKSVVTGNIFFNNSGGVYRYFSKDGSGLTLTVDDPLLLTGKSAGKIYYLSDKSGNNITADPSFKADPDFFEKYSNRIQSEGGGKIIWDDVNRWRQSMGLPLSGTKGSERKNFAPVYEEEFVYLFGDDLKAGARRNAEFVLYSSSGITNHKSYQEINYSTLKEHVGKNISVKLKVGDQEMSGYYVEGIKREEYICFRTDDRNNFIYVKNGSEALDIIMQAKKEKTYVTVKAMLYDISTAIKMSNKFAFVVDNAESED